MDDNSTPAEVRLTESLGPDPERAAFEAWAAVNGYHLSRDDGNPERYHAWVTNTLWLGWQARAAHERTRCRYPQCVENEDERCPRWLTGECEGPNVRANRPVEAEGRNGSELSE